MPKPEPSPTPSRRPQRVITYKSQGPGGDSVRLGRRLMREGLSYDRIPQGDGTVVIIGIGDSEKHSKKNLAKDLAKDLDIEITEDRTTD